MTAVHPTAFKQQVAEKKEKKICETEVHPLKRRLQLQENCNKTKIKLKHKTVVLTSATKLQQNVKLF
jgi:hypothetical protein